MNNKFFIAVDGLDGSGKETQTKLMIKYLESINRESKYITFPTYDEIYSSHVNLYLSGRFGDDPNTVNAYAASSFYASDRYCSYMLDWKKDYDEGKVIISNRYTTANAVHQISKLPESEWDKFLDWLIDYEFCKLGLPNPDLVLYLCVPPDIALNQINKRSEETGRTLDIHEKDKNHLINSYNATLYSAKKLGWVTIDCTKDNKMRSIEDINNEIVDILKEKLI